MTDRILKDDNFFRVILDAIPISVIVVDSDVRIQDYNLAAGALFEGDPSRYMNMRGGNALNCLHSRETPDGCGHAEACKTCVIRNSVRKSYEGWKVLREKHKMRLLDNGKPGTLHLHVTTSPFEYKDRLLVLLMIEDITELTELAEIIPICSGCKKIRNDQKFWENVEHYLAKHLELKFTHGLCPDCAEKMYPDYFGKKAEDNGK